MTVRERNELLEMAVPRDSNDPRTRRFNIRRGAGGLDLYDFKYTQDFEGEPEFHGHPTSYIPGEVLRVLRDDGKITSAEHNRLRKQLG